MASDDEANAAAAVAEDAEGKTWRRKGKHDKPKPWDEDPNIDHWKIERFDPSWNEGGMLEVSSFSTLFPQYRDRRRRGAPQAPGHARAPLQALLLFRRCFWRFLGLHASPVESFLTRFAAAKLAVESALSEGDAAASLAAAAAAIDDLDRLVAESSHALPPYELRSTADLRAAHRAAASEIRPRSA
jgi:hypothetical protein